MGCHPEDCDRQEAVIGDEYRLLKADIEKEAPETIRMILKAVVVERDGLAEDCKWYRARIKELKHSEDNE